MLLKIFKNEVFIVITLAFLFCSVFFYKCFLGNIPLPADLIVGGYYPWVEDKQGTTTGVPVKNPMLTDAVSVFYPLKTQAFELIKAGEFPGWNRLMFTGYPIIASLPVGLYFPTMIFYLIFSNPVAWTLQIVFQVFFSLLSMYALARHLNLSKLASLFSAVSFSLGGFSIIWLELNSHVTASSFLPLLLLLEDKLIQTRKLKWGVSLSLALAFQIFAGYIPITLFILLAMAIWFFLKFSIKSGVLLTFFIILGFSLSSILLFPSFELFQHSQRPYEILDLNHVFVPPAFLVSLVSPDYFGNPVTGNFWGSENYMNAASYTGIMTLVMSLAAVISGRSKLAVKFSLIILILTLLISFNNPLAKLFYQLGIWGGSSITMHRTLFLINFSLSLLAGIGMNDITKKVKLKYFLISIALLLAILLITSITAFLSLKQPSFSISLRNMIFPSLIAFLGSFVFLLWVKFKFDKKILQLLLLFVLIIDLFRFGWKFLPFTPTKYLYPPTSVSGFLQSKPGSRFVGELDIMPPNMWVPYKIESLAGYESVYPLDIAKLIAVINTGDIYSPPQTKHGIINSFESRLLDITGTNYILTLKRDLNNRVSEDGEIKINQPKFKKAFEQGSVVVLENTQALPRAYLTSSVINLKPEETIKTLMDPNFPVHNISISEDIELSGNKLIKDLPSYQEITNNHIRIKTTADITAMLVVLESFYPGWVATIDGQPSKIHKVNYAFKGVVVPKGSHVVNFYYQPQTLRYGVIVTFFSMTILLSLLAYQKISAINFKT